MQKCVITKNGSTHSVVVLLLFIVYTKQQQYLFRQRQVNQKSKSPSKLATALITKQKKNKNSKGRKLRCKCVDKSVSHTSIQLNNEQQSVPITSVLGDYIMHNIHNKIHNCRYGFQLSWQVHSITDLL